MSKQKYSWTESVIKPNDYTVHDTNHIGYRWCVWKESSRHIIACFYHKENADSFAEFKNRERGK